MSYSHDINKANQSINELIGVVENLLEVSCSHTDMIRVIQKRLDLLDGGTSKINLDRYVESLLDQEALERPKMDDGAILDGSTRRGRG